MAGLCARCGQPSEGLVVCARCGAQPIGEATATSFAVSAPPPVDLADGPTFIRRLTLGAITLFGLYQGLKYLTGALA